jgi:hypothetical protein
VNRAVELLPRGVLPVVARGGDDDEPRVHQPPHGLTDGVVLVGLDGGRPQAQVDDAHVVERAVGQDPVERAEDARDAAHALRVEHAQVDEVGVWRHARVGAVRDAAVAGDDGGDVRAVTVGVIRAPLAGEVLAISDAAEAH